jgi:hypothetical protein
MQMKCRLNTGFNNKTEILILLNKTQFHNVLHQFMSFKFVKLTGTKMNV